MTTEAESPFSDVPPRRNRGGEIDDERTRKLVDLIDDVSILIDNLFTNRLPDSSSRTFVYPLSLTNPIALPQLSLDRTMTRELSHVTVTLGTEDQQPSFLSIDVVDEDASLHISRSGTGENKNEPDHLIDNNGNITPVRKTSLKEINWLLMSLIRSTKLGDYGQFNETDLLALELYEDLADSLEKTANSSMTTGTYVLNGGVGSISFTVLDHMIQTFSVTYETAQPGRQIIARGDYQTGVDLDFFSLQDGIQTKLIPDLGDILKIRELIGLAIEESTPIKLELTDVDSPEEAADIDKADGEHWEIPVGTNVRKRRYTDNA